MFSLRENRKKREDRQTRIQGLPLPFPGNETLLSGTGFDPFESRHPDEERVRNVSPEVDPIKIRIRGDP